MYKGRHEAGIIYVGIFLTMFGISGLKGSDVGTVVILGIIAVRNFFLPVMGLVVVKAATHFGLVGSDLLLQFVLMLQYAAPPAMATSMYLICVYPHIYIYIASSLVLIIILIIYMHQCMQVSFVSYSSLDKESVRLSCYGLMQWQASL